MSKAVKTPEHREQRFSLRKFSFGAASILVGSLLFLGPVASAEELSVQPSVVAETTESEETPALESATSAVAEVVEKVAEPASAEKPAESLASTEDKGLVEAASQAAATEKTAVTEEPKTEEVATPEPKWVTKQYAASNTLPTNPNNNAMARPAEEGEALTEGTGFRATPPVNYTGSYSGFKDEYSNSVNVETYRQKNLEQLKNSVTWIDFAGANVTNLDRIIVNEIGPKGERTPKEQFALRVGTQLTKEIAPGYVITVTVKELKPFETTQVYKERLAKEGKRRLPGESQVNENLRFPYERHANRVIVTHLDQYSTVQRNGWTIPGRVQFRSAVDGANIGIKYDIKATYLGKEVPVNVVLANAEEALGAEMAIFTTNGENFELLSEVVGPNTKYSYRPMTWEVFAHRFPLIQNAEQGKYFERKTEIISRWLNVLDSPNSPSVQKIPGRTSANSPVKMIGDGIGTKVYGPVQDYAAANMSTPNSLDT